MNDNEKLIHLTVLLKTELTVENVLALKEQVQKCQKADERDDSFTERSWYLAFTAMTSASSLLSAIDRIQKPERKKTHNAPFVEKRTR